MKNTLDPQTYSIIKDTIDAHRKSRKVLIKWKEELLMICKKCLSEKQDSPSKNGHWKCECDVQFFLDLISEFVTGEDGFGQENNHQDQVQ